MNIMIYGKETDSTVQWILEKTAKIRKELNIDIVAYLDEEKNDTAVNILMFSEKEVNMQDFLEDESSKIIICKPDTNQIIYYLTELCKINKNKIEGADFFIKQAMTRKYKDSPDHEIQEILNYWKTNPVSVFNQFISNSSIILSEVMYDEEEDLPYIMFFEKRMYYPKQAYNRFLSYKNKKYVESVLYEQQKGSPHLYIDDKIQVNEGDVIVDAGVCEGNFALRYVDLASKIYLIECDEAWIRPLQLSFRDYKDKVVICNKKLGAVDDSSSIRLDTLIEEKIDFLKIDIEGAELDALDGAEKVLRRSHAKCSVCAYHRSDHEEGIKQRFEKYGYETYTSNGYMLFLEDPLIYEKLDFRRGIVYAYPKHESN